MVEEATRKRWRAEFEALGAGGVRNAMVAGRWPEDKRACARAWLERRDVEEWQAKTPVGSGGGLALLKNKKRIWGIIAGIAFGGFALIRVLSRLKAGF